MKKLILLKWLVRYLWITGVLAMGVMLFSYLHFLFTGTLNAVVKINGVEVQGMTIEKHILLLLIYFSLGLGLRAVFLLDDVLDYFKNLKPFSHSVIKNFNEIGVLFVVSALITGIPCFLLSGYFGNGIERTFSVTPGPIIMLICLGLFFMVLSELFKIAKAAKEENELTV
ncbi:DUF2975 domain-containing protein [Mangrovimonas xylaniphaga]|uniref:DUF2975 domain-containing protein n=1 Tax=Mangrovimonas xylaniphaga TaxID=1645915 RepID=UPI0006B69908|nr:DUF2975 domain-containing protein [Mangrovimonas xylaniphaga]